MKSVKSDVVAAQNPSWRRLSLLLGLFFTAFCLACLIPTPGAWSDVRPQWLGAAAATVICIIFLGTTARIYWRGGSLTGLQASLLCFIFGALLAFMMRELFISMLFLHEAKSLHACLSFMASARNPQHTRNFGLQLSEKPSAQLCFQSCHLLPRIMSIWNRPHHDNTSRSMFEGQLDATNVESAGLAPLGPA
jgi:hypothetical protein